MTTPARWRALHWYADHEINVNAVMGRPQPSTRMRNLMLIEQQLDRVPVGVRPSSVCADRSGTRAA